MYLTLLKMYLASDMHPIAMVPVPVPIPPDVSIPECQVDTWTMVPGEVTRIIQYQTQGDVTTFSELQEYLRWLWQQSLFNQERLEPFK